MLTNESIEGCDCVNGSTANYLPAQIVEGVYNDDEQINGLWSRTKARGRALKVRGRPSRRSRDSHRPVNGWFEALQYRDSTFPAAGLSGQTRLHPVGIGIIGAVLFAGARFL